MSDLKNMGVKITLDREREMVFNLNGLDACIEKYGKMDDVLNSTAKDMEATRWLAVLMLNEGAEIHNDLHPDDKIQPIDETKLKRYTIGMGGIVELQNKVREALLQGLPKNAVQQVEEMGKNLMAAQTKKQELQPILNGATMNRAQRRAKTKK